MWQRVVLLGCLNSFRVRRFYPLCISFHLPLFILI
uniref:Uncharacterized protein n=1 Tax=Brassica oleracea TaxID=3712 RepID=A0A3P6DV44_BRAOL|nr:unnamed protein product [Brassica oleracea]